MHGASDGSVGEDAPPATRTETIMDGELFDALVRRCLQEGSRRGVLRADLGALAASALGLVGLIRIPQTEATERRAQKPRAGKRKVSGPTPTVKLASCSGSALRPSSSSSTW